MKKTTIVFVWAMLCLKFNVNAQTPEAETRRRISEMTLFQKTVKSASAKIGLQTWMVKNLDVSTFRNGDKIKQVYDEREWRNAKEPVWRYVWEGHPEFGKFYNSYALKDERGLAPEGWHIPTLNEWNILYDFIAGDKGLYGLTSKLNWPNSYRGFTNTTGFYAIPLGTFTASGNKSDFGQMASFWASPEDNRCASFHFWANPPAPHAILNERADCGRGMAVRCIKD